MFFETPLPSASSTDPPGRRVLLHLDRVTKCDSSGVPYFNELSLLIRSRQSWGIFNPNYHALQVLLRCIYEGHLLDKGNIITKSLVSWPIGVAPGLKRSLSCAENSHFFTSLYGKKGKQRQEVLLIREMTGLSEESWRQPMIYLSNAQKKSFKLSLSLAFEFDLFVIDSKAYKVFKRSGLWSQQMQDILEDRLRSSSLLLVGANDSMLAKLCKRALVIDHGNLVFRGTGEESVSYLRRFTS